MKTSLIAWMAAAAALIFAPIAHADGNAANLDQIVGQAYTQFQARCTPGMPPQFQRVVWDSPPTGQGGHGRIVDGTQAFGGPFQVSWSGNPSHLPGAQTVVPAQPQGYWDIAFEFC
jgi:hypothetical protein